MATSRIVNTKFWRDPYVKKLNPDEKLLFIYLLTNSNTTLAGIYEITIDDIEFETKIDVDIIAKTLHKFQRDGRILFERDWLVLTNFLKHQRLNPSVIRGVEKAIEELPEWLRSKIDLAEDENKQLSIFIGGQIQTGDRLVTDGDTQYNLIKSNLTKFNQKKSNQTDESVGDSGKTEKQKKRDYAIAMEREREQKRKAEEARNRPPSGIERFQAKKEELRNKS